MKQDGYAPRTAADLERKYNFGQTFADIYGLASDVRKIAEDAQSAFADLDQEQIFNLLTNFGEAQGIYRDDAGEVYINASYIKSGKLSADYIDASELKVAAANITGELVATQINTKDLKVLAANITGTLKAGQIDTTNLIVSAANITGTLNAVDITGSSIRGSSFVATGNLSEGEIDSCFTVEAGNGDLVGYIGYSYEDRTDKIWIRTLPSDWNPAIKLSAAGNISLESDYEMVYISAPNQVQMVADEVRIKVGTSTWVFRDGELLRDGKAVISA